MHQRAARQSFVLRTALALFLGGACAGSLAAAPPPLNLQSAPSSVKCGSGDPVVYVDNFQGLGIYYKSDQSGFTGKPDQSAGLTVTGYTCLSIATANGLKQALNVIPITGPNGVSFNLYPTVADAQKKPPNGCGGTLDTSLRSSTIVYVSQGRAFRLDDSQAGKGFNAYTCWSEAQKGGLKLNVTLYKQAKDVPACPGGSPVVYADNSSGETGYYLPYQAGFKSKPGTGGYLCKSEADELHYKHLHEFSPTSSSLNCTNFGVPVWADQTASEYYLPQQHGFQSKPGSGGYTCQYDATELSYKLHVETLATAAKNEKDVKCTPPDRVIVFDGVRIAYGPVDFVWNQMASGFACLNDAKSHGFRLDLPLETSEKRGTQICGADIAWFTPSGHPTLYMRSTNPHYAEGDGVYSCGHWGTPFLGARPATPDDAKIPPPFTCNHIDASATTGPPNFLSIGYAGVQGGCNYDLDQTTITPALSTACGTPPNAYVFTTGGRKDVLRVSLMLNGNSAFRLAGMTRAEVRQTLALVDPLKVLCFLSQKGR